MPEPTCIATNLRGEILVGSAINGWIGAIPLQAFVTDDERKIGLRQASKIKITATATNIKDEVGLKISSESRDLLSRHPLVKTALESALDTLRGMFPVEFTARINQFTDPYDGTKMLVVSLDAPLPYIQTSQLIDRFCENDYELIEKLPAGIVFQAGD
jgi:hypothetical protein